MSPSPNAFPDLEFLEVNTFCVANAGAGTALYIGGRQDEGVPWSRARVVRFDGKEWSTIGGPFDGWVNSNVYALQVFDSGSGPVLYAAGRFESVGGVAANNIARWTGSTWVPVGDGLTGQNATVYALEVFDDGSGPALFAGGRFTTAGGVAASNIAKWNGSTWSAVGSGVNAPVRTLTVHNPGSGPALFVGGEFTTAGGAAASRIARWNGAAWSSLGPGVNGPVRALRSFNSTSGPVLFVGGEFTSAGGSPASRIAIWNGSTWAEPAGGGLSGPVTAFGVFDDGTGPALHAAGEFQFVGPNSTSGGTPFGFIAKWTGSAWNALGTGVNYYIRALASLEGNTKALYVGGLFNMVGNNIAKAIGRWDGREWHPVGVEEHKPVLALTTFDDGTGNALYAGGDFTAIDGYAAPRLARWDGTAWSPAGGGLNGTVRALVVFNDGTGPALYVAGEFTMAGNTPANRIAKWNGTSFSPLGSGLNDRVNALVVHDDGTGPALYAGGWFSTAGGIVSPLVARWNGSSWSSVGNASGTTSGYVNAMVSLDDGTGPSLVIGGDIDSIGGVYVSPYNVARWQNGAWSKVGQGLDSSVDALAAYNDGTGTALYAGGNFWYDSIDLHWLRGVVRLKNSTWKLVGNMTFNDSVKCLHVHDDGTGPALYADGFLITASTWDYGARWNGTSWKNLQNGPNAHIHAMATFDAGKGAGPALHLGGAFTSVNGKKMYRVARWGCPEILLPAPCPDATATYGSGTPGCLGTHDLRANQCPKVNAPTFAFLCDHAPANSLGLGIVTDAQDLAGSDPFGIGVLLHVDVLAATETYAFDFPSDATGQAVAPAPIPNAPILAGKSYYASALWAWTQCPLPPFHLSTSRGLSIRIQP